jgi:hypothetical protein
MLLATHPHLEISCRSCLQSGQEKVLLAQVRAQFKVNLKETDDGKIKEQKEAAIRALHNVHLLEADRYVREKNKGAPGPLDPDTPKPKPFGSTAKPKPWKPEPRK